VAAAAAVAAAATANAAVMAVVQLVQHAPTVAQSLQPGVIGSTLDMVTVRSSLLYRWQKSCSQFRRISKPNDNRVESHVETVPDLVG
jgi:protein-S-isoprenylcysteine O-methyltransferase Ste14